jgi:hypothetical protein
VALLDDTQKQLLMEQWLPRLRDLRDQRKPIIRLMIGTLLAPLAASLLIVISLIINQDLYIFKAGISSILLGLSALAFVYLGKLQNCNDVIVVIECSVYLGDRDQILKSISNVSCLGRMQDLLHDSRPFLKGASS